MRTALCLALLIAPLQVAYGQGKPGAASDRSAGAASDAVIFAAAGFAPGTNGWSKCGDPGTASYTPGTIEQRGDFNADGRPDAVITEGSAYCFGDTGTGYTLVSQQADGSWRIMAEQTGMLSFLTTSGVDGWPDIAVGGPGFCFPVLRWNGSAYAPNRREYEGRAC